MQPEAEHAAMKRLLEQNQELLKDNNRLLRKIHRNAVIMFWVRLCFYLIILGSPIILYFFVIEPYLASMGATYESILDTSTELLNGLNSVNSVIKQFQ